MKIVHICLNGVYSDGFSYQENLLAKYHKKMGLTVEVIANCWEYDKNGKIVRSSCDELVDENGVHITRLQVNGKKSFYSKFKSFKNLYNTIEKLKPDILFVHGINFIDIKKIIKYMKNHPSTILYMDNHCDYANSATNFLSKYFLHRGIWRYYAKKIERYVTKFYGVLPSRVDFIIENYKISSEKCELLIMGADDEIIKNIKNKNIKEEIRKKYNIKPSDFLIVTGGKIDLNKKQILLLMKAVRNIEDLKIRLIIFGSVSDDLKKEFEQLCDGKIIQYVGWVNQQQALEYFYSSDLVSFPGLHSVYWEQVVALGIPLLNKYIKGVNHIDIGGNIMFLKEDSVEEIENALIKILSNNKKIYLDMKKAAESERKNQFLYSKISKNSINNFKEGIQNDEKN